MITQQTTELAQGTPLARLWTGAPERTRSAVVLSVVIAISAWFVGAHLLTGWVPADDGYLGQGALRVLQGQLPHRDFGEIYTGGLDFIHAAAFRLFGVNLVSLRIAVFLVFIAWVAAFFRTSRHFVAPITAGAITLVAVAWSFPNYPAAMPSWYNLFFATFGALSLLAYVDKRSWRWAFLAGLWGGASFLMKVIGAYYIAGVLLFFVFKEQSDDSTDTAESCWLYRIFVVVSLIAYLAVLLSILRGRVAIGELYHFVLPSIVLVVTLIAHDALGAHSRSSVRFRTLFAMLAPFTLGLAVPVVLFLAPYLASGSVGSLLGGTSSSAVQHISGLAVAQPLAPQRALSALFLIGCIIAAMYWEKTRIRVVGLSVVLALALLVATSYWWGHVDPRVWLAGALLTPLIVLVGAILLLGRGRFTSVSEPQRQKIMLLVALAATCSLVQFPFPVPIYFCYSAPLTLLAMAAIVASRQNPPGRYIFAALLAFFTWFGAFRLVPSYPYELTHTVGKTDLLRTPRGGIRIEQAAKYEQFVGFLQQHSPNGLMYAGVNCPELYFLTGLTNPLADDGGARGEQVLQAIDSRDLKLVVINDAPFFPSGRTSPELKYEIYRRLPNAARFGIFTVMWRP